MNLDLNIQGFEQNLIEKKSLYGGVQYLFRFANRYGASVVKHDGSYGSQLDLWELAVIYFDDHNEWEIDYDTAVTSDVEGYLKDEICMNKSARKSLHKALFFSIFSADSATSIMDTNT